MRRTTLLALAGLAVSAGPALAQTYTLDKVEIDGLKSADPNELRALLPTKPGDKVTVNDLIADQDALTKALESKNIVGGITTSMRNKPGKHIDAIFTIADKGVQAPETKVITKMVDAKLGQESITGNKTVDSAPLLEAANLHEGDTLTKESMSAAAQRILDAYKKQLARHHKEGDIGISVTNSPGKVSGEVDLTWVIKESNIKRASSADTSGYGSE